MNRAKLLQSIQSDPKIDVLVIGGGINGIGAFRDLALQGVRVLLVERGDFCSGASAASSHMVHGGLRYLENGEFRLVREAVSERNRLLKNAPHLVKPLPTTIPIFRTWSGMLNAPLKFLGLLQRPSERGALVIKIGLAMYDAYTGSNRAVPRHEFLRREKAFEKFPRLNPDTKYAATYFDGAMHSPERLGLEVLMDGIADSNQAFALNYVRALGIVDPQSARTSASSSRTSIQLRDELAGDVFEVIPKLIVNAAGPWIDWVNESLGQKSRFIGGTKGSHLVLDHPELLAAINGHEIFFENKDGRITLIYPFQDRVLIGTSDLPVEHPDDAICTDEEVDYFLEMLAVVFPTISVSRNQIVFKYSGVRPLPYSDAKSAGQISRDHSIEVVESESLPPTLNLVGGKWTTFRAFAEQTTDRVLAMLGRSRTATTKDLPIGGGKDFPTMDSQQESLVADLHARSGMDIEVLRVWLERYGTRFEAVAQFVAKGAAENSDWLTICEGTGMTVGEIIFLIRFEMVQRLEDLVLRRSLLAMKGMLTPAMLQGLAEICARELSWSKDQMAENVSQCTGLLYL